MKNKIHFEHRDYRVCTRKMSVNMFTMNHPTPPKQNGFLNSTFFIEWSAYLDELTVVTTGDLNSYLDSKPNSDSCNVQSNGLRQHVTGAITMGGDTV